MMTSQYDACKRKKYQALAPKSNTGITLATRAAVFDLGPSSGAPDAVLSGGASTSTAGPFGEATTLDLDGFALTEFDARRGVRSCTAGTLPLSNDLAEDILEPAPPAAMKTFRD